MIYTWECTNCGNRVEVTRSLSKYDSPPKHEDLQNGTCSKPKFKKIIGVTPVMFEKAYDSGVFERIWKHPNL